MAFPDQLYDPHYYEAHAHRSAYQVLARFLAAAFGPRSAVDFGCGIGETLGHLQEGGCEVLGLDGSDAARQLSRIDVRVTDLSAPVHLERKYDLAISTEVAEHLSEGAADQFVANIAAHARQAVFFTAAQPGQGGVGHVNCQPKAYWADKFARHGFTRSRLLELCAAVALYPLVWDAWWIRRNALVLVTGRSRWWHAVLRLPRFFLAALCWRVQASGLAARFRRTRRPRLPEARG
jgi:SAM-dependent methyltransferase